MRRLLVAAAAVASLAGCATKRPIEDAEKRYKLTEVKAADGCESLGIVRGRSKVGNSRGILGRELAIADAIRIASERGATHYVLTDLASDNYSSHAQADAYRCTK